MLVPVPGRYDSVPDEAIVWGRAFPCRVPLERRRREDSWRVLGPVSCRGGNCGSSRGRFLFPSSSPCVSLSYRAKRGRPRRGAHFYLHLWIDPSLTLHRPATYLLASILRASRSKRLRRPRYARCVYDWFSFSPLRGGDPRNPREGYLSAVCLLRQVS